MVGKHCIYNSYPAISFFSNPVCHGPTGSCCVLGFHSIIVQLNHSTAFWVLGQCSSSSQANLKHTIHFLPSATTSQPARPHSLWYEILCSDSSAAQAILITNFLPEIFPFCRSFSPSSISSKPPRIKIGLGRILYLAISSGVFLKISSPNALSLGLTGHI